MGLAAAQGISRAALDLPRAWCVLDLLKAGTANSMTRRWMTRSGLNGTLTVGNISLLSMPVTVSIGLNGLGAGVKRATWNCYLVSGTAIT